jgi:hypothetical protein
MWISKRLHRSVFLLLSLPACRIAAASDLYAGLIGGVSTLSADAGSQSTAQGLSLSAYSPQNGGALNVFGGAHLHNYFSLQANYIWNRNDLILSSTSTAADNFYEQARTSAQSAFVLDGLVYFRRRSSRIRPYLGTGAGIVYLSSTATQLVRAGAAASPPPAEFRSTRPVFRSHVGIDLRIRGPLNFRYSFSESIGKNDISRHLSPRAPRRLANFQNLFGFSIGF